MTQGIEQRWSINLGDVIGSGGFGRVYGARGADGKLAAAKYVPKSAAANRDLLALSLPESTHIIPVLEVGETDRDWILIMPRAEHSLRDLMQSPTGFTQTEALKVLTDVAHALVAIDGIVVHRDLKPENILFCAGAWAVCDFGISRYAEANTAADTRKFSMTPPYAAPEQWRMDHATGATDVYAFGILAFELLTGATPFLGPTSDDYRKQHLFDVPPAPPTTRRLKSLLLECLDKAAEARPRPQNLLSRLQRAEEESQRPGASSLAGANQLVVEARSAQSRQAEVERSERERREALFASAVSTYSRIFDDLIEIIEEEAPTAQIQRDSGGVHVQLGSGSLDVLIPRTSEKSSHPYDVVAYGSISIAQSGPRAIKRSHSLYFCDLDEEGSYAWFELAFMAMMRADFESSPYALPPSGGLLALSPVIGGQQLGRPVIRLTLGDLDDILDRWTSYLGQAAQGLLAAPMRLPEGNPQYPRRNR